MPTLSRDHRRLLENTVAQARTIAVDGARKVLTDQYAVHHHEPWPHMTAEQRELRNQFRAHGRQLGDRRDDRRDTQELEHLVQACAYEHWHRMLFARFLAENDLLLDADHGMAMSLDEDRELAREQNRDWLEIAAELAQKMLLAVFRPDDPVLRVSLPPETRQELEAKLEALPTAVFRADDSLGWVYQFWQRDEKDRVNKSEVKIGADELPAVTQLFTEDYMVLFLLENTLGAWWAAKRAADGNDPSLPGYQWTYLRLSNNGLPVAGSFGLWPRAARDIRVLDPCMGSGHFLTFALRILARMRSEEEGLDLPEAVAAVLRDNLFGLELDARCSQIAAFNLALASWRVAGSHFTLPDLNLACSGLGINASKEQWMALAGENGLLRDTMAELYTLFRKAPSLGSLIDPTRVGRPLLFAKFEQVWPLLQEALSSEPIDDDSRELAVAAKGLLAASRMLASKFTLVATNVSYLGRGRQDDDLKAYCEEFYSDSQADLANCFVDRCIELCTTGGTSALVTKQELLFQGSYIDQRARLVRSFIWNAVAVLGPRAFETLSGERVIVCLLIMTSQRPAAGHVLSGWDVSALKSALAKGAALTTYWHESTDQLTQLENPDSRILLSSAKKSALLGEVAQSYQGIKTGDDPRMRRFFWEIEEIGPRWRALQSTVEESCLYGGRESVIDWLAEGTDCARLQGLAALGRTGIAVSQSRGLPCTIYTGDLFDSNVAPVLPTREGNFDAVWTYCTSEQFASDMVRIDPKFAVANSSIVKVPFDLGHWVSVAADQFPEGLPLPHSDDPSQWFFAGHPKGADHALQVAVSRMLGYRWPRQNGASFFNCPPIDSDDLADYEDQDGIVSLHAIAGEASAADRLRTLLASAYKDEWSAARLQELLGKWDSLGEWLRDGFFEEHCLIFQHRPYIWHVWDGRIDGFHAFVNYHKLAGANGEGRQTLEKLIYTYLGDWVSRQQADLEKDVEGADGRLSAALHLKAELEKVLKGEKPYDVFVRWKALAEQPIGWEPDNNDGVRLNIRPWLTAKPYQAGRRDGCILRITPRMNYGKDRGKEPHRPKEDFPWFWSWDGQSENFLGGKDFDGSRWNELHYSLETKKNARERKRKAGA
ncbi:MAG: Eco57I restriction-modification methylase domain-containing protein [Acidobacteriota bacterium]